MATACKGGTSRFSKASFNLTEQLQQLPRSALQPANMISRYDERGIAEGLLASCDIFDPVAGAWRKDSMFKISLKLLRMNDMPPAGAYRGGLHFQTPCHSIIPRMQSSSHKPDSRMVQHRLPGLVGATAVLHCRERPGAS